MREKAAPRRVRVWDVAVRLLHWALAASVAAAWILDDGGRVHRVIGYVAAGIVAARLAWALLGTGLASLRELRPSLGRTLDYLRAGTPRQRGHDPLGLWMVWLLWLLVLLLALSGWISGLDAFWGDERVQDVHAVLADALLVAVVLHLAGVAAMCWRWRENLPWAMVTGRKRPVDEA